MTSFIVLLRAVNVGGTGKLPMTELRALCERLGFSDVRTYIQSGNVVLRSPLTEAGVTAGLAAALAERMGKPVGVISRTLAELHATLRANPFPDALPSKVGVQFLPVVPATNALAGIATPGREAVALIGRELFIHYPDGIGRSKLRLPAMVADGTMRNLNTVRALAALAAG